MKNITINDVADDSSSFSCLPDDIVLLILSKLIDFRTLCLCILVSKRFSRIVLQVDTISFQNASSLRSYGSAISCLKKFERVKSLRIQHPSSFDTDILFKWKVKFGNSLDSFLFLSVKSVYHNKDLYDNANGHEQEEEEDREFAMKKADILEQCMNDVFVRIKLSLFVIILLPLLEKVTIEDSGKRGKVSLSGEKVTEMRNSLSSADEVVEQVEHYIEESLCTPSGCYIPLLELPVSKYVMKGVALFLIGKEYLPDGSNTLFQRDNDDDDSEDREEAAYSEAVAEIFKNHRGRIQRVALV